ncbi:hypothetical protein [Phenylobacterium sp.]|uniref:terminase small subunit-like protein n=1 Tax=Phenylobacterium sp. TaxID=1871053 RepID=UPI002C7AB1FB|nr:hypothetical protein [Phenylobacterium sp.]HLZ74836.1 hypothetical protein [Phenylobacterium sp.]
MSGGWNRGIRWSAEVGEAVIAGTRAGHTLAEVCAGPGMPTTRSVVRWSQQKPAFGAAMRAAREAAGLGFGHGLPSTYDTETAEAICARLCVGERVKDIMADPDMPGYSTYFRWQKDIPEFRRAVAMAREISALRLAEEGWEAACEVTPETAFATKVMLEHLRWYAGKLSPKRYGPVRPRDAGKEGGHTVMHVYTKRFSTSGGPDGEGRWSDEPARHLYSMIPEGDPSPRAGEALPPPAVVREPASTQGPDARGEARGGMIEVEYDPPEGGADEPEDDFWAAP